MTIFCEEGGKEKLRLTNRPDSPERHGRSVCFCSANAREFLIRQRGVL